MSNVEEFGEEFHGNMVDAVKLFDERNAIYKNGWERSGYLMKALFPDGIELKTDEDHARFSLVSMLAAKLSRYCTNFTKGGHEDSIQDLTVYANILFTFDKEIQE